MNAPTPESVSRPGRSRQLMLAGASVLSIGLAIPIVASAGQGGAPAGSGSTAVGAPAVGAPTSAGSGRADRQARQSEYIAEVAAELGVPTEKLQSAMDTVRARHQDERLTRLRARLDRRVAAGRISQEQADRVLEAARSGQWPRRR